MKDTVAFEREINAREGSFTVKVGGTSTKGSKFCKAGQWFSGQRAMSSLSFRAFANISHYNDSKIQILIHRLILIRIFYEK